MSVERKFLRVSQYDEEMVIEEYSWFGWRLVNAQDVHENDVNIEYDFVLQPWLVTSTTDYVKLILERDTSNPNYRELVQLENEYYTNMDVYVRCYDVRFGGLWTTLVWFIVLFSLAAFSELGFFMGLLFLSPAALIFYFRKKKIKREKQVAEYALDKAYAAKEKASQLF